MHFCAFLCISAEASEGLRHLTEISQDPIKKHILEKYLGQAIEESRDKVRKIQQELGKSDDASLTEAQRSDRER